MRRDRGFTLVELMIVVALIAVVAAVAVYLSRDRISTARSTEVTGMFTEFRLKQEAYKNEAGRQRYLSTGADESDKWPAGAPVNSPRDLGPIPATWQALNFKVPRASSYCSYVAVAGDANDGSNIGAKALEFGFATPTTNWYYLLAECNFDGDGATNSFYFSSSTNLQLNEQNPGR